MGLSVKEKQSEVNIYRLIHADRHTGLLSQQKDKSLPT